MQCIKLQKLTVHVRFSAEKESSVNEVVRITLRESQETKCVAHETISVFLHATIYLHFR